MAKKTRYTDEELAEFQAIINEKLRITREDYAATMRVLTNQDSNDVDDTSPTYKALEEGSSKERLRAVPHATLSVASKMQRKK